VAASSEIPTAFHEVVPDNRTNTQQAKGDSHIMDVYHSTYTVEGKVYGKVDQWQHLFIYGYNHGLTVVKSN
jgi:hypothetical protein